MSLMVAPVKPKLATRSIPILIVEEDLAIRRLMTAALHQTEFHLIEAENGLEGLAAVAKSRPEAVLLELGLPDLDGIEFVRRLREWSQVPVIVVSDRSEEHHKIAALEGGADDYVTKPFSVGELLARIRTSWRRAQYTCLAAPEPVLELGDLAIDVASREVTRAGISIHLTPIEYKLLLFLARHSGRVVTQQQILTAVWGDDYVTEFQYLRVYVGYLRKKLEHDPSRPTLILTEPRVGYRLKG